MKNLLLFVSLMLSLTLFTSCATLFTKNKLTVTSDVENAQVYLDGKYVGNTPLVFKAQKQPLDRHRILTLKKDGYESQSIETQGGLNAWWALDCFAGGIGGLIDLCAGKTTRYSKKDYFVSLLDPSVNERYTAKLKEKREANAKLAAGLLVGAAVVGSGVAAYAAEKKAENAQKAAAQKAAEKARRERERAEMEAHWAEQRAQAEAKEEAKRREENARLYGGSNSLVAQMEAEKNRSQSRSMGTSDLAQYNATQMSNATYGSAATNQALAQQRQYDAQQNTQTRINQRRIDEKNLPGAVENAITSSGAHIQIKVNSGRVVAYSTSNNSTGAQWNNLSYGASVSKTTDRRYGYEANLGGGIGKVYWGEPTSAIADNLGGTSVNAVTTSGKTIQIRVAGDFVIAYRTNSNMPWNGKQTEYKRTNVSSDGDNAARFKYKANIPGVGTVYF